MQVFIVTRSEDDGRGGSFNLNIHVASTEDKAKEFIKNKVEYSVALQMRGYTRGDTEFLKNDYDKHLKFVTDSLHNEYDIETYDLDDNF